MRSSVVLGAIVLALAAGSVLPAGAQGRGAGMGRRGGMCAGAGMGRRAAGQAAGYGAGYGYGWWTRVKPTTDAQRAFVARVADLHTQMRAQYSRIALLQARKTATAAARTDTQKQVAECRRKVTALRAELVKVTRDNADLLEEMGVPAGAGICDGTGARGAGFCPYGGQGTGRGMRDGTGPNPNCPLKQR